jgi:hypothetical protein
MARDIELHKKRDGVVRRQERELVQRPTILDLDEVMRPLMRALHDGEQLRCQVMTLNRSMSGFCRIYHEMDEAK